MELSSNDVVDYIIQKLEYSDFVDTNGIFELLLHVIKTFKNVPIQNDEQTDPERLYKHYGECQ